jgi:hypothetical protein
MKGEYERRLNTEWTGGIVVNIVSRFIQYLQQEGFYREKEVAFPHKQAVLMRLTREAWEGPSA